MIPSPITWLTVPSVAVHRLHHVVEHRVEDLPGFFGIAVGQELHRALEIREEDRHVLPFTFERALGGEDLLGEMFRRVSVGGREANWFPFSRERGPAGPTEPLPTRDRPAAARAGEFKACAAVLA